MRNSTNIFLTNLSIADLLVLLVCTPTVLVEVNTKPETWVLGHEMCEYSIFGAEICELEIDIPTLSSDMNCSHPTHSTESGISCDEIS